MMCVPCDGGKHASSKEYLHGWLRKLHVVTVLPLFCLEVLKRQGMATIPS